jgi:hypothetical protein
MNPLICNCFYDLLIGRVGAPLHGTQIKLVTIIYGILFKLKFASEYLQFFIENKLQKLHLWIFYDLDQFHRLTGLKEGTSSRTKLVLGEKLSSEVQ